MLFFVITMSMSLLDYIFVMSLFHNIFPRSFTVATRQEGPFPSAEPVVSPPFDNPHHVTFPDLHGFHLIAYLENRQRCPGPNLPVAHVT